MPLDVRGHTHATMKAATCERVGEPAEPPSCQGSGLVIIARERGIPSKRESRQPGTGVSKGALFWYIEIEKNLKCRY